MQANKLKAKASITRALMALLGIILGIFIMAQIHTLPTRNVVNPTRPITSLKETREILYAEQNSLKTEIESLQNKIDQLDEANQSLSANDLQILKYKKSQAGLSKLAGPGVVITLDDNLSAPASSDTIVHAADIRDIVNLLWGSTAEAVSINGERVVATTAIDCIVNTILINNTRISNPFVITAIGDKHAMHERLSNKNILTDLHARKGNGLLFNIEMKDYVIVNAFAGLLNNPGGAK